MSSQIDKNYIHDLYIEYRIYKEKDSDMNDPDSLGFNFDTNSNSYKMNEIANKLNSLGYDPDNQPEWV